MAPQRKRPISVWIAQILLGIYGVVGLSIVLWGVYTGLTEGMPNPELFLFTTVGLLAFNGLFIGGFWGMVIRKPWGRWLGVVGVAVLLIATAVNLTSRWYDSGAPYILFTVLALIGLAFLVYKLAAGDAAEEFFNGRSTKPQKLLVAEGDNTKAQGAANQSERIPGLECHELIPSLKATNFDCSPTASRYLFRIQPRVSLKSGSTLGFNIGRPWGDRSTRIEDFKERCCNLIAIDSTRFKVPYNPDQCAATSPLGNIVHSISI